MNDLDRKSTKYEKLRKKSENESNSVSVLKEKCVDDIFQFYVAHAMWILISKSGGQVSVDALKGLQRTAFFISGLIRPAHRTFYNSLFKMKSVALYTKRKKLRESTVRVMSEEIYDKDFCEIFKIINTLCKKLLYIPILKEFTTDIDPTTFTFEIDLISNNVYKIAKKGYIVKT